MTLVDTSVLLDLAQSDPVWADWSQRQLEVVAVRGPLLLNPIVYAELGASYPTLEALDSFVETLGLEWSDVPREALFLASKAHMDYRRRGGRRTGVLPDFFIGAHALVMGVPLLTRDRRRYETSFPALALIAPDRTQ
ncbi:type II toxin-antitoxin system VapC family toxin [Methyloraptor flagellatus]|uniref:Type II toxin-antitoxin system VapC family toxin n=1 Tax=Methyloraptor flagellatus TaxID=3162530 RepID=A0AAU7XF11_9HYPH